MFSIWFYDLCFGNPDIFIFVDILSESNNYIGGAGMDTGVVLCLSGSHIRLALAFRPQHAASKASRFLIALRNAAGWPTSLDGSPLSIWPQGLTRLAAISVPHEPSSVPILNRISVPDACPLRTSFTG